MVVRKLDDHLGDTLMELLVPPCTTLTVGGRAISSLELSFVVNFSVIIIKVALRGSLNDVKMVGC